jgi:CheY-like chemotaxis protein
VTNDVVLIVDDSKFIAQAYSRVLLDLGYRVLIACDGTIEEDDREIRWSPREVER